MNDLLLREARQEDATAISELITKLTEAYIVESCSAEGRHILLSSVTPDAILNNFKLQHRHIVIEDCGKIVAALTMKNDFHLFHLFVATSYQRRGLARTLWNAAIRACLKDSNIDCFTVNSSLTATDVYLKLGFKAINDVQVKAGIPYIPMEMKICHNGD